MCSMSMEAPFLSAISRISSNGDRSTIAWIQYDCRVTVSEGRPEPQTPAPPLSLCEIPRTQSPHRCQISASHLRSHFSLVTHVTDHSTQLACHLTLFALTDFCICGAL